jgi:hypothetical integral membrane protein (TIGR02206 family)
MEYQFYSEGFFGYGEKGDFQMFGFWHFLPIALLILAMVLTTIKRNRFREWKYEVKFRYILSFVMLMAEMSYFWRLLYVGNEYGGNTLMTRLPMQLCQWGLICCVFMIISLNDTLFGLNYFITFFGAIIAIASPIVLSLTGPTYFRYYQFWLEHLLPIYGTYYAMTVHGKRPKYWHLWLAYGGMLAMAIPASIVNLAFEQANYFYLKLKLPMIPENYILRVVIYSLITIAAFHLLWGVLLVVDRRKKRVRESVAENPNKAE